MTNSRRGTRLRILVLFAFVAITAGIDFCHTETGVFGGRDCPACQFLTSSLSLHPAVIFVVPSPVCRRALPAAEPFLPREVVVLSLCSRSPPQA